MRTLIAPPAGRTVSLVAPEAPHFEKPGAALTFKSSANLSGCFERHARPHGTRRVKTAASAAALAFFMTTASEQAAAQFICQQYGGAFGGLSLIHI